jgi:DNA polymerase (family 10)
MPSENNQKIADIFYEMADILEMQNVQWKPRAYRQAAKAIESLPKDVEEVYKKGGIKLLEEIPGVGEGIGKKIVEFIKTGKIKAHDKLMSSLPSHMNVLLRIPGMGPKKAKKLNELLKISTVEQLESAAKSHKIASIPGFGEKSEQDILDSIAIMRKSTGRIPLKKAEMIADGILAQLKRCNCVDKISVAGSLRRKKATIGDIDILVSSDNSNTIIEAFTKVKEADKVIAKGSTKAVIITKDGIQVDLRVLKPESWGAGLLYFTGSKNLNIQLRKIAIKKGLKLNEYGLFDKKTNRLVASKTEEDICKKLGVKLPKPEERDM